MQCEKCGSENVIEGKLSTGFGGVVFTIQQKNHKEG
jgi:predicted nucleic-acid-binding Zn-ribbon protein